MLNSDIDKILLVSLLTPMDDPTSLVCRWGVPILLWGPPAVGKSARVEQAGTAYNLPVRTLYLSTITPEDLSGIPMKIGKNEEPRTICTLPQIIELREAQRGVLFLDEFSTAANRIQSASLGVVYTRYVAGKQLPSKVRIVAAANPPDDASCRPVIEMAANRFIHIDVPVLPAVEWGDIFINLELGTRKETKLVTSVEDAEKVVQSKWASCWARAQGQGVAFLRSNDKCMYVMPPQGHPSRSRAWPSPRSWEMAFRLVAAADALNMKEIQTDLVEAAVGEGAAQEWAEWVANANLPDPKDALENCWVHNKFRDDITYAVYSSTTNFVLAQSTPLEKKKYALLAWKMLTNGSMNGVTDLAVASAKRLVSAGWGPAAGPECMNASKHLMMKMAELGMSDYV